MSDKELKILILNHLSHLESELKILKRLVRDTEDFVENINMRDDINAIEREIVKAELHIEEKQDD